MNDLIAVDVNEQEKQFMNQIIQSKGANLPDTIDDIVKVFEFTDLKAKAFKLLSSKMSKLDEQVELHQAALRSGQQWGIASLYAQKRMGEITREMPKNSGGDRKSKNQNNNEKHFENKGKIKTLESQGIHKKNYVFAEQIANNPDALEETIQIAKANNDIPNKAGVLKAIAEKKRRIAYEHAQERGERIKDRNNKKRLNDMSDQVKVYIDTLKGFKSALEFAVNDARNKRFSPESKNFIIKKHNEIKEMMNALEEMI